MKSITIHGIDDSLWSMLQEKATSEGFSLNKIIKEMLEISLGIKHKVSKEKLLQFKEFCGIWSKSDLNKFNKEIKDFEKIDKEEWK